MNTTISTEADKRYPSRSDNDYNLREAFTNGALWASLQTPCGGWTRVEDGLPENRESVLCLDRVWQHQRQNSYEEHTDQNKEWFIKTYSHWMPLPNKPENI